MGLNSVSMHSSMRGIASCRPLDRYGVCFKNVPRSERSGRRLKSVGRHVAFGKSRPPKSNYNGMTSGLSLGNFAIVASLTLRCWATIAGGVRAIQSDRETSAK
jgi:hypothetical protein